MTEAGLANAPLLLTVRITGPTVTGVMVNVCGVDEFVKVSVVPSKSPPPDGVMTMVPLNGPFGATVKLPDGVLSGPPVGPENAKLVAPAKGTTELDAADPTLVPTPLLADTVHVYGVPFVSPDTVIGLLVPVPI